MSFPEISTDKEDGMRSFERDIQIIDSLSAVHQEGGSARSTLVAWALARTISAKLSKSAGANR
jgi:hypothetical protein